MGNNDALRLLFVAHYHEMGGGAEFVLDELIRNIRQLAPHVQVLVAVPAAGSVAERMESYGAEVRVVQHPRWADFGPANLRLVARRFLGLARGVLRARTLLTAWHPDAVVTNTMTVPAFALAAKSLRVPHIWLVHEFGVKDHHLRFLLGYRPTMRLIGQLSSRVVCPSQAVAKELEVAGAAGDKLMTIYYGVDTGTNNERRHVRRSADPLCALIIARIAPSKGQLLAVRAALEARRRGADVRLSVVGHEFDGPYARQVREEAGPDVRFVGQLADLTEEYLRADVLLMCSRNEAFGRVTVEAMKLGLPVIGVESGGTCEIIDSGKNGYLVAADDFVAIGDHLVSLWADEETRAALATCARRSALHRFVPSKWVEEMLQVCRDASRNSTVDQMET